MKKYYNLIISYFPTSLPVGKTEYDKWAASIIEIVGPIADEDSLKWAISSQVLHLDAHRSKVPKQYFVRALRKAAANQVASAAFQEIKQKQQDKAKEEAKENVTV